MLRGWTSLANLLYPSDNVSFALAEKAFGIGATGSLTSPECRYDAFFGGGTNSGS
jgi:hypothetical protein